jgi:hypothetical protein
MTRSRHYPQLSVVIAFCSMAAVSPAAVAKDVPYVPTPEPVVTEMLRLAKIDAKDFLYDLGSGDGRIVITAAKAHGARGVGVDIDPERISESRENAKRAAVTDKVKFIQGNLFEVDLRPATAVTLYLLPDINLKLRPKLLKELRPGTPVVSHAFDMDDWEPEMQVVVDNSTVYLWHIPQKVAGTWRYEAPTATGVEPHELQITQSAHTINGTVTIAGRQFPIRNGSVSGHRLSFTVDRPVNGERITQKVVARVEGNRIADVAVTDDNEPALRSRSTARPAG